MEKREGWKDKSQLPNQVRYLRENPRVQGSVFFSSKSLTDNLAGFQDSLRSNLYCFPALQPPMLWLDNVAPQAPLELKGFLTAPTSVQLSWKEPFKSRDGETAYGYVIYRFIAGEELNIEDPAHILKISFDNQSTSFVDNTVQKSSRYVYLVTAIDRLKNESMPSNQIYIITF